MIHRTMAALVLASALPLADIPATAAAAPACTQTGTAGDDVLRGTADEDVLCGLGGDDILLGEAGDDVLRGGAGDDRLVGGAGDDELRGGPGDDLLVDRLGDDVLNGGSGSGDVCVGSESTRFAGCERVLTVESATAPSVLS